MNIEIGKRYFVNKEMVVTLAYNQEKEVLLVKETDGNLLFILGEFAVNNSNIISINRMSYTVTEAEMLDCINTYITNNNVETTMETVANAVRNTYYQIPRYLAEVVAEWYMK